MSSPASASRSSARQAALGEDEDEPKELTPKEIVRELDKYVIGQNAAKRAVAIALRNRWRRWRIEEDIREEIAPNNIILIGSTGVGKTEIARRLARLAQAPFVKVEASKFTEVGYVGRDVESMIRDLVEISVNMVRSERTADVEEEGEELERAVPEEARVLAAGPRLHHRHRKSFCARISRPAAMSWLATTGVGAATPC